MILMSVGTVKPLTYTDTNVVTTSEFEILKIELRTDIQFCPQNTCSYEKSSVSKKNFLKKVFKYRVYVIIIAKIDS